MADPAIPFGYRRISGQSQKGDGIWNGTRFVKVRKEFPWADHAPAHIIIRKCAVEQTALPVVDLSNVDTMEMSE